MSDLTALEGAVVQKQIELRQAIEAMTAVTGKSFTTWAPHPSEAQVMNCQVVPSRYHILDYMPKGGICIEVGTQTGTFALEILKRTQPKKLHLIDLHPELFLFGDKIEGLVKEGIVEFHQGYSQQLLEEFEDEYFDWIYIDADHSYEGFKADLKVSARKLKPNGYICCNDYTVWSPGEAFAYGILQGLHEFVVEENWEFAFIGLHGQGYHDVCIRPRLGESNPAKLRGYTF